MAHRRTHVRSALQNKCHGKNMVSDCIFTGWIIIWHHISLRSERCYPQRCAAFGKANLRCSQSPTRVGEFERHGSVLLARTPATVSVKSAVRIGGWRSERHCVVPDTVSTRTDDCLPLSLAHQSLKSGHRFSWRNRHPWRKCSKPSPVYFPHYRHYW